MRIAPALAVAGILAACGEDPASLQEDLHRLTADVLVAGCAGPPESADDVSYAGTAVNPFVAVDPGDPKHIVGVWEKDRWSRGGASAVAAAASFDGGASWLTGFPPFSRCTKGAYARVADPWVTIAADGSVYVTALAYQPSDGGAAAVLVSRSADGGLTWEDPTPLVDQGTDFADAKVSITADPLDFSPASSESSPARPHLYAVWSRFPGAVTEAGQTWLARATDGVWEPARAIYAPASAAPSFGNVIVVLPDGTLVDVFGSHTGSADSPTFSVDVVR